MPEIKWTKEQLEAINFHGGSAIVSAAAGSGKTAVLVERVIRILKDKDRPVKADELVIATFTEKAAGELKTRLNNALLTAMKENPHDEYLKEQLIRLEDARISTISSLCMNLLRSNSAAVGLSPDFSVLDGGEGELMFVKSLETVMEDFYENAPEEDRQLLYDWYGGENDDEIFRNIRYVWDFLRKLPDPEKSLGKWLRIYENPADYADDYTLLQLKNTVPTVVREIKSVLADADVETEQCREFYEKWYNLAVSVKLAADEGDVKKAVDTANAEFPKPPRKTAEFDSSYVQKISKKLKEIWGKLTSELDYAPRFAADAEKSAPLFRLVTDLALKTDEEFSKRKRIKNKVDFADAEIFTLKLLRNENAAAEIRRGISVIIVDEFQDSNDMQYEIFCALSRNKQNLYFVGDIKQSIYRFRGANPLVFSRILEDDDFTNIYLNRNFRSSSAVIDSVNAIFETSMTKEVGEVDYDDNAKLVLGAEYDVDESDKTELIRIFGDKMTDARESEAAYIADRIRSMVESGFKVTGKGGKRPCRYGDFAVLMGRYRTSAFIYKKAFMKAGIPFEAKDDGAFTDLFEINLMLSLLRIIDNPYHNKEMAAVLVLPPYCFTADELSEAKLCGGKPHKHLWSGMVKYAVENEKAAHFVEEFRELREYAEEHSVEQLIRKIYDESDVVTAILAMPDGDKRDANLKLLLNYARRFSENGIRSLYDFLQYMENVSRSDVKLTAANSAEFSGNSVKIMTIHGSKGLEFPICIVANLASDFKPKSPGKIIADIDYGIGMQVVYNSKKLITNTLTHSLIKRITANQELSESMRLLYVAATRAKEKLIFTAPVSSDKGYKNHLKWVLESGAIGKGLISFKDIFGYEAKEYDTDEGEAQEKVIIKPFTEYKYSRCSKIPAKVTATQVGVKGVDDFAGVVKGVDRFLRMPSFVKGDRPKKLSGKKKGDAYHKAMELLSFTGDVSQLDALHEKGKLNRAERASISDKEIEKFLGSDLCRRINESDEIHKEFPIFCEYNGEELPDDEEKQFVQGIADLFFIEDGEIVLVDYKTNTGVTEEALIEEYRGQLKIYGEALVKMTGRKLKECYLWAFTLGKAIKVDFVENC